MGEYLGKLRCRCMIVSEVLLLACKELLEDAKLGCADLVFKDICLEILAKAKQVLTHEQFEELSFYAAERMKDQMICNPRKKVKIQ